METQSIDLTANQVNFIIDMMWDVDPDIRERLAVRNGMSDIQLHDQLQLSLLEFND